MTPRVRLGLLVYVVYILLVGMCFLYQIWPHLRVKQEGNESNARLKTILLWTPLYKNADWGFGLGQQPFKRQCTGHVTCRTTVDRSEITNADMVIFFIFTMTSTLNRTQKLIDILPRRGKQGQVFVFWNHEPPLTAFGRWGTLGDLQGVFNITVTYRRDSTIWLPLHRTIKLRKPYTEPNPASVLAHKEKLACWVVSACQKTHSRRLEYADELANYIDFDVYGGCGNLTCPGEGIKCFQRLSVKYKFYFAFENSYCWDYMTEKAFRTLKYNWVPVVLGAGNYTEELPPHSFIDVRNFRSPKELAQYLQYLDKNDDKYFEYFKYKRYYRISRVSTNEAFCKLCNMLHGENADQFEKDLDPDLWWDKYGCIARDEVSAEIHLD